MSILDDPIALRDKLMTILGPDEVITVLTALSPSRPADPRDAAVGRPERRTGVRLATDVRLGLFDLDPQVDRLRAWASVITPGAG